MAIKDDIKTLLENSYELSRGEIIKKLGIDREQARKPISKLLEAKEIERRVDDNGVEWFCFVGEPTPKREGIVWKEEDNKRFLQELQKQSVEASQGSGIEVAGFSARWNNDDYTKGYEDGKRQSRVDIEYAIGKKVLELLGVGEEA